MPTPELSVASYQHAWMGIAIVCGYYLLVAIVFRFFLRPSGVLVTKYEPPAGISPAMAALLWERGGYERAFTAAFISIASKGFLRIEQHGDKFCLHRMREKDDSLSEEEAAVFEAILPGEKYCFDARECGAIDRAFAEFRGIVAQRTSQLISQHLELWIVGIVALVVVLAQALAALSLQIPELSLRHVAFLYLVLWMAIGGSCFVAALHAWAATGQKLLSYIPGVKGRRRPLNAADALAIFLTASALLGFGFLGSLTSPRFAGLVAAALFLSVVFRRAFESPNARGCAILQDLRGFREFVARADASRLNLENSPGRSPEVLEKFTAYGVALEVERGWGEELAESLLELLQFDNAYAPAVVRRAPGSGTLRTYPPAPSFIELGISHRKVSE